ncbi:MAG: hypothetical protein P4L10_06390 [Acidobacteriaceae bacterium]|nr:hypothetical protein [Acidobacteriaceae bacterium]
MRRRTRYSLMGVAAVLAALVIAVVLRKHAPPECARLLPESDAIVYFNLKPIRTATHFDRTVVQHSPEFQRFIDATGFVFERDLDQAAFAIHRMPNPNGPNGPLAFSEVFEGRIDGKRLTAYLNTVATAREVYAGHEIFSVPVEGRTLRVAMLGYSMVAASNTPTTEQIHSILDHYRSAASPFAGSSLLAAHYSRVPLLSVAWGIGKVGLPFSENGKLQMLGLTLPISEDTTFVASIRYLQSLHLRVEELAPNDAAAADSAAALTALLNLVKTIQKAQPASDPGEAAMGQMIDSLKVEQEHNRTVLTGTVPLELMKKVAGSPDATQPVTQ